MAGLIGYETSRVDGGGLDSSSSKPGSQPPQLTETDTEAIIRECVNSPPPYSPDEKGEEDLGLVRFKAMKSGNYQPSHATISWMLCEVVPEVIYENGDIILNFCTFDPRCEHLELFGQKSLISFRVASAIVSLASMPLSILCKETPDAVQPLRSIPLYLTSNWASRRAYSKDRAAEAHVGILCSPKSSSLKTAFQIVFSILHFKTEQLNQAPKAIVIARVAEVALAFLCLGPIVPWVQTWLLQHQQPKPSVEALRRVYNSSNDRPMVFTAYESLLLSFAMGDASSFARASVDYILTILTVKAHNVRVESSIGILGLLSDDLWHIRNKALDGLLAILNDTYNTLCGAADEPLVVGKALMLGAYVQTIHRSFGTNTFPLTLSWNYPLSSLFQQLREIQPVLTDVWKQMKAIAGSNVHWGLDFDDNPWIAFGDKITQVRTELKGLDLTKYRPDVVQLLDIGPYVFPIVMDLLSEGAPPRDESPLPPLHPLSP